MARFFQLLGLGSLLFTFAICQNSVVFAADDNDSQQERASSSSHRQLAMALPRPTANAKPFLKGSSRPTTSQPITATSISQLPVKASADMRNVNPDREFAGRPQIVGSTPNASSNTNRQIPDNVRTALIEGAVRAEQLSRSYNRRIADLIVWIANSMNEPTTISPVGASNLRRERIIESRPISSPEQNGLLPID